MSEQSKPDPAASLAAAFPRLAAEWHPEKNTLSPRDVVWGSGKHVWWTCPVAADHVWRTKVQHRTQAGSGCPFCVNKKLSTTNSLLTVAPELAAQLDPSHPRLASEIIATSHERVLWRCPKGPDHRWHALARDRVARGTGCPFCCRKRLSVTNSLARVHPELAREFAADLNGITADRVVTGSNKRYFWRCAVADDHVWKVSANNRIANETGCPFCCGQRASVTNSLARYPDLVHEFHPTRNAALTPADIPSGSTREVHWRCQTNPAHEWSATVVNRTRGRGCPHCSPAFHSKKEIGLAAELALFFDFDLEDHKVDTHQGRRDVDIVLRSQRTIIEFDGHHWHKDRRTEDLGKTRCLEADGWRVVRVREKPLAKIGPHDLLVSRHNTIKQLANAVLAHLARLDGTVLPGFEDYLADKHCQNADLARQVLATLVR